MKLAVIILVLLGIVAAGAATILVQSLPYLKPGDKKEPAKVSVLVAASDLPARTSLTNENVRIEQVPAAGLPMGYFADPAQAIGKTLKVAVSEGQPLTELVCTPKGNVDDLLRPGMLAFPIQLSQQFAVVKLMYPGCIVDVFATFTLRDRDKGDALVVPLLQNIQVLGVADVMVVENPSPEQGRKGGPQQGRIGSATVTLELNARQVAALQLVGQRGSLTVALRNPLDQGLNPMEPMVIKEGQLTAATESLDNQTLALYSRVQQMLSDEGLPDPNALAVADDPNSVVPSTPAVRPPVVSAPLPGVEPRKTTQQVEVIRGAKREEVDVERGDQNEKTEEEQLLQEVGG